MKTHHYSNINILQMSQTWLLELTIIFTMIGCLTSLHIPECLPMLQKNGVPTSQQAELLTNDTLTKLAVLNTAV